MASEPVLTLPIELLTKLRERYAEPHRHYHALGHVDALLRWLDRYRALAEAPAMIEAAIWFHDAMYDTRRHDNEARSADWARDELTVLGWPEAAVRRVVSLVLATQRHEADASDADAWLFLDLDLSVLGQSAETYAAYSQAVRAEYAWVDEAAYREGRAKVLRSFIERERIYRTPTLHEAWGAAARSNLQAELDCLLAAS